MMRPPLRWGGAELVEGLAPGVGLACGSCALPARYAHFSERGRQAVKLVGRCAQDAVCDLKSYCDLAFYSRVLIAPYEGSQRDEPQRGSRTRQAWSSSPPTRGHNADPGFWPESCTPSSSPLRVVTTRIQDASLRGFQWAGDHADSRSQHLHADEQTWGD